MTNFHKVEYIPLSQYSITGDTADKICAVEASGLFNNYLFPQWSSKISLSSGTTYTVGNGALASYTHGYVWHSQTGTGNNDFWCNINGTTFRGGWYNGDSGLDAKLITFPVSTGDYFICNSGDNRYFIPTVGSV